MAETYPTTYPADETPTDPDRPWLVGHPDGYVSVPDPAILEVKTATAFGHDVASGVVRIESTSPEAKITARLDHPKIAQVIELGTINDQPYIALEYVDGRDLPGAHDS